MLNGLLSLAEAWLATCLCFHWAVVLNGLLVNRMMSVYAYTVERFANIMKLAVSCALKQLAERDICEYLWKKCAKR